jgi:hypothetical protein
LLTRSIWNRMVDQKSKKMHWKQCQTDADAYQR